MGPVGIFVYLLLFIVAAFPATASAGPQTRPAPSFPAIASASKALPAQCQLHLEVISSRSTKWVVDTVTTSHPVSALPQSTLNFTQSHINEFLAKPGRHGDWFGEVTRKNCGSTVEFFLILSQLGDEHEVQELWEYLLTVEEKKFGKRVPIVHLIVSAQGKILYGDKASPYWAAGTVTRGKNALRVDIVDRDGETVDKLVYPL